MHTPDEDAISLRGTRRPWGRARLLPRDTCRRASEDGNKSENESERREKWPRRSTSDGKGESVWGVTELRGEREKKE
eukprot:1348457-Amorphochlora_amoeboformis.AAC.1